MPRDTSFMSSQSLRGAKAMFLKPTPRHTIVTGSRSVALPPGTAGVEWFCRLSVNDMGAYCTGTT